MDDGAEPTNRPAEAGGPGAHVGQIAWAIVSGLACLYVLLAVGYACRFDSVSGALHSIDFNGEAFADLLGPYWRTAESLAAGGSAPDPQYLYPATLACLLQPLTSLGELGASWAGLVLGLLSIALLISSALLLEAPGRTIHVSLLGALLFISFPVVHGVYWANAGPLSLGAGAAGWALASRGYDRSGGALIGVGAAIKILPAILILGLLLFRKRRAALFATLAAVCAGVLFPILTLGLGGFIEFHRAAFAGLGDMASSSRTPFGGRGSQDLVAFSARLGGSASPWWGLITAGAAGTWALSRGVLRTGRTPSDMRDTLPWLLAIPGLLVSPTWAHGLVWLPLAWWMAAPRLGNSAAGWALLLSSLALSSLPAAWLTGDPTLYLISGAPLVATLMALGALAQMSPRTTTR